MDNYLPTEVVSLLEKSAEVSSQAENFADVMVNGGSGNYDLERYVAVVPWNNSKYDFEVRVDGRKILAIYSRFCKKSGNATVARGRFKFLLIENNPFGSAPLVANEILSIDFGKNGEFALADDDLDCFPNNHKKAETRWKVLLYIVQALQKSIFEDDQNAN